ncbi:MAG TPA: aminopeptidase [Virgibacillus sp.]|nr:aminopeptidase [Virgibacillus sp.]
MKGFQDRLEEYAELAVKVALNIQKGQKLYINADIEHAYFVEIIARKAYEVGAVKVYTDFFDPSIERLTYEKAPEEGLADYPDWKINMLEEMVDEGGALLNIYAPDPELLKDIDPERIALSRKAAGKAMKASRYKNAETNGSISWCVLSVPTQKWAAKVFPEVDENKQVDALWEQIFNTTRINLNDPVSLWKDHLHLLQEKADYLNRKKIITLHYEGPGTKLSIGLADDSVWKNTQFKTKDGVDFLPNVPSEEVFTVPHKDKVNGTIAATKPLNYDGNLIENFSLTFKHGKVVDFQAKKGEDILKHIIETDEGTKRLGEVALVPHNSLISNSGVLFYNTLFDENASCHIALGNALLMGIEDADSLAHEELIGKGFNESIDHIDLMVGSRDLNIDGETDEGERVPIFTSGNWAF